MSRMMPPHELHRQGLQNDTRAKSRPVLGRVESVDAKNGKISVSIPQLQEQFRVNIPLTGFSMNGSTSSWMRYMPQKRDHVHVQFEPDNTPLVTSYAAIGDADPSDAIPRQSGYKDAAKIADMGAQGLRTFRVLYEGEWDARSSGGAEFYGNRFGTLLLAGGPNAVIKLHKQRQEIQETTRLRKSSDGDGMDIRWGRVTRALIPNLPEKPVLPQAGTLQGLLSPEPREWHNRVAVGSAIYYDEIAGDVRDAIGVPILSTRGVPIRYRKQVYGLSEGPGLSSMVMETSVDATGHMAWTHVPTGGVSWSAPAPAEFALNFGNVSIRASSGFADVDGFAGVRLGGSSAGHHAVLGEVLVSLLSSLTVTCAAPGQPSSPPLNAAAFATALSQWVTLR